VCVCVSGREFALPLKGAVIDVLALQCVCERKEERVGVTLCMGLQGAVVGILVLQCVVCVCGVCVRVLVRDGVGVSVGATLPRTIMEILVLLCVCGCVRRRVRVYVCVLAQKWV